MRFAFLLLAALVLDGTEADAQSARADLFGVKLGAPLSLARCPDDYFRQQTSFDGICAINHWVTTPAGSPLIMDAYFSVQARPFYAKFEMFQITIFDGVVQKISVFTNGIQSQNALLAILKTKFGPPSKSQTSQMGNMEGANFDVVDATWMMGTDTITFTGALGTFDSGIIEAISADEAAKEAAVADEQARKEPHL